jgi:hypothetical protein
MTPMTPRRSRRRRHSAVARIGSNHGMKLSITLLLSLVLATPALADDYTVEPLNEAPPAEIASPVRAELAPAGLRVKTGAKTLCDIWFRKAIPSAAGSGIGRSYPNMPDMALIGAIRVVSQMHDNRHNNFTPGVYTIRHGIQPQDGNHAGSTPFIDFALLLSAKTDVTVDGGFDTSMTMIRRSQAEGGTGHPVVFALLPPTGALQPSLKKNEDDRWVLDVKAGDLSLAMVLIGVYEH